MPDANKDVKFSLKVVINKQKTKVLFAEADSDFTDVLLSFLTLPLGKVVRVLEQHYKDDTPVLSQAVDGDGGVFTTTSHETFLISDDLEILPNVRASFSQILSNLGITDIDGAEVRSVTFGLNEILELLKGSFLSPAPLTNLVLKNEMISDSVAPKSKPGISLLHHQPKKEATANSTALILKVIVQKSTSKLLFAEADENFVDFLFSLLTIPLGGVEYLLDNSTSLKNIDNLCPNDDKYLRVAERTRLTKPTLPHGYLSKNRIFCLTEERVPQLKYIGTDSYLIPSSTTTSMSKSPTKPTLPHGYLSKNRIFCLTEERAPQLKYIGTDSLIPSSTTTSMSKSPKGDQYYVKGPRMYMVKDDLTVAPLSMISYFSTLNEQKVPLPDVRELVLHIGLEEALSILKASLSSSCAISNGLNHMLKRQPKQEHSG